MDRKIARAHAMKLIYEWEMGGDGGEETRINLLGVEPGERESQYMNRMVEGVMINEEKLDASIAAHLRGWTIERISKVDLAILRLAVFEMKHTDIPAAVAINEAVELTRKYSQEESCSFINGVLGTISRKASAQA